jgi:hypothetical protein
MRLLSIHSIFLMIVVLAAQAVGAQQITSEDKNAAIQTIAKQIAANYIFPEKGGQIAMHLHTENFKGAFNKAENWKQFDELVTKELKSFSHDDHLYVSNDPEIAKGLKETSTRAGGRVNIEPLINTKMVQESKVIAGNIGYLKFTSINITRNNLSEIADAMNSIRDTKALVIDLRDNGGGGSEMGPVLESYFLPAGKPTLQFTTRDGNVTVDSTVNWLQEKRYEHPVYIIVNRKTASAAEAFAFILQQNRRAKIIGETSSGAAYMNSWFAVNDENFVSVSTAAPSLPGKELSWQDEGVQPDIRVKKGDALEVALKEAVTE